MRRGNAVRIAPTDRKKISAFLSVACTVITSPYTRVGHGIRAGRAAYSRLKKRIAKAISYTAVTSLSRSIKLIGIVKVCRGLSSCCDDHRSHPAC